MHWSYGPGFREYVSRTARGLGVLALTIAFMLSAASAAFATSSSITDLASSTHPDDAWRSSDGASFSWRQKTDYNTSKVGRFPMSGGIGVAVAGNIAYVTDAAMFKVLDVSDPSAPTLLGQVPIGSHSYQGDIVVSGTMAYVVANVRTIAVDVSDPAHPVERGHFASAYPVDVAAVGTTLYIADNNAAQLYVVDASNPDDLKLLGNCGVGTSWGMSSIVDGRLAVASATSITLVDVSDPTKPTPIGSVGRTSGDEFLFDVEISGNTMYAASLWTGLMVYDITDPAHPTILATSPTPIQAMSVKVSGDRAYVVDTYGGLFTFDVSNRLAPVQKGKPVYIVGGEALAVQGRFAYVAADDALEIIDVWDPPALRATPAASVPSHPYGSGGHAVAANRLYTPRYYDGFDIFDVTSPAAPVKLGSFNTSGTAWAIAVKGDYAFVLDGAKGLKSFDVSNPATPKIVGEIKSVRGGDDWDRMTVSGNILVVKSLQNGISIIDITDPRKPSVVRSIPVSSCDIDVSGDFLYAVVPSAGVHVIDISRPESSTTIAAIPRANSFGVVTGVAVEGDSLFVSGEGMGVTKYDVSDPRRPVELGFYQGSGDPVGLDAVGDTLYIASRGYGLDVVDFSDPRNPVSLGRCDTPGDPMRVEVVGTTAYVGDKGSVAIITGLPQPRVEYSWDISSNPTSVPDVTAEGSGRRVSLAGLADGEHYFKVRAVLDGVAQATQTKLIRIDATAPTVTLNESGSLGYLARYTLAGSDALSGVTLYWRIDGGPVQQAHAASTVVTSEVGGSHTIEAWATDGAGNESAHSTDTFQVTVPLATLTVAGSDRFATAVEVSKQAYPRGAHTVVVATGMNWPDALGGSALAGALDAPILLVTPDTVPAVTAAEIARLGATDIVILGGPNAVSARGESALSALVTGSVERIGGANRYRTAELVAARSRVELGADFDGTVFVTSGTDFADAVAAGPMAARNGWPLYLAEPGRALAADTKTALAGATRAIVLGGTSDVNAATQADLVTLVGQAHVERVAGTDRYGDVVAIARYAVDNAGFGWDRIGIATGANFPDSLTGGLLQAKAGAVLVLTPGEYLQPEVAGIISKNSDQINSVTFFGGVNAVGRDVRDAVSGARDQEPLLSTSAISRF